MNDIWIYLEGDLLQFIKNQLKDPKQDYIDMPVDRKNWRKDLDSFCFFRIPKNSPTMRVGLSSSNTFKIEML